MEIKKAEYLTSSPSVNECPNPDRPEIAFIGRSNVGKSSLINMLTNKSKLAKTSATPGKTQMINFFEVIFSRPSRYPAKERNMKWYLADLPGYGFAKISQSTRRRWEQMIEGYIRKRRNLVNLFVLIDCRIAPQKIDLDFVEKLGKWAVPFALIFTKSDKNKPNTTEKNVNLFMEALEEKWEKPPVFFLSSTITKAGRNDILDHINRLNNN